MYVADHDKPHDILLQGIYIKDATIHLFSPGLLEQPVYKLDF